MVAEPWIVLLAELPADLKGQVLAGAAVLLVLDAVLLFAAARNARINRRRRGHGRAFLTGRQITDTRMSSKQLVGATDHQVADTLELARQMEWEREQAAQEMAKYGRSRVRGYCRAHDRWCRYPERRPHPSGGFDNEQAPASWKPVGEGPLPTA